MVTASAMSFQGAYQRTFGDRKHYDQGWLEALAVTGLAMALVTWWMFVITWYSMWIMVFPIGILFVGPYRAHRKNERMNRQIIEAIKENTYHSMQK